MSRGSASAVSSALALATLLVTAGPARARLVEKIAAVVDAPRRYTDADLTRPTAFIVGSEDEGLSEAWRSVADEQVAIPMRTHTADSLNAATSAAVLLFEAVRQRG